MVISETPNSSLSAETRTVRRAVSISAMRPRRAAGIISCASGLLDRQCGLPHAY